VDNIRNWNCWIRNDDNEQLLKPKWRTQQGRRRRRRKHTTAKSFHRNRSRNCARGDDDDDDLRDLETVSRISMRTGFFEVLRIYGTSLFGSRLFNFTSIVAVQIRCRIISAVQTRYVLLSLQCCAVILELIKNLRFFLFNKFLFQNERTVDSLNMNNWMKESLNPGILKPLKKEPCVKSFDGYTCHIWHPITYPHKYH
jgi:hypothetical protein